MHFLNRLLLALFLLALGAAPARAQGQIDRDHVPSDERVDIRERRQTDVDGNQVRTTIFNFGQSGRTSAVPDEIPYEWPKNTRRHYIALTGLFVGAEVTSITGETAYIVDVPNYRENTADENRAWTFAPVEGYVNPAGEEFGIARSDRPETWPPFWPDKLDAPTDPGWPGSWNGYFGRDVFNADQEVFYRMGDDEYDRNRGQDRTTYYPDTTDLSRAGLGLLVDTRVLQWSQVLIDDAVFILHAVKNDGTEDLQKVGVTLWLADLVGGDPDADDDNPFFDLLLDTAFLADSDGRSNSTAFPSGQSVGAAIAFFLESPGNATDRIDNDGDGTTADEASAINALGLTTGEPGSPVIDLAFIQGEGAGAPTSFRFDGIDNNGNGLIDEDSTYAAFGTQVGVGFADRIDNDGDGEPGSPVVTQAMVDEAAGDLWGRWPAIPGPYAGQPVHLIQVGPEDLGLAFRDFIDNDGDGLEGAPFPSDYLAEPGSPVVTQAMVDAAAGDAPYFRYAVPGTSIILYDVGPEDLGLPYADGIDNDGDGAVDEGIDEHIDEMIDERRDDGIDNDGDWRPLLDDVGLDGAEGSGDPGEGDGVPTSGAGTDLPGESNIDVTDVSESDQIGITNVKYEAAGSIQYQTISDGSLFTRFMVPGQFVNLTNPPGTDNDLFVSSGTFPLRAGQTERVSFAVILGDVNYQASDVETKFQDLLQKRQSAQEAYEADYRFAQAPLCPSVTAVPGNGRVTLYWDRTAEESFDTFIADLPFGLDPRDFEGYKVYRATDPAFLDAQVITDGFGNVQFLRPIAQFDLINQHEGFHPVDVQGTHYYLGNNLQDAGEAGNGLAHTFTDSTAVNGIAYYYAVVSYDHGAFIPGEVLIAPSECPIRIRRNPDGSVETGQNVVQVTPSREAAGYVEATLGEIERVRGFATGTIGFEIVDPVAIENGHRYRLTFTDTLVERLVRAERVAVLTGAGISAESGVPTFRDPDGLWQRFRPEELANVDAFMQNPTLVQGWYNHRRVVVEDVQPNAGHEALAELEALVPHFLLATQNVDDLHRRAGSRKLVELHGNLTRSYCIDCGTPAERGALAALGPEDEARCAACGGLLRPDVVWFGEMLPEGAMERAAEAAAQADVFLSVGTSAVVYPAAGLPLIAKESGAYVAEVNVERSAIARELDEVVLGKSGEVLPMLVAAVRERKR